MSRGVGIEEQEPIWLNEPSRWRRSGDELTLDTEQGSSFWRLTGSGEVADSGHHFGVRVPWEFSAGVAVRADLGADGDEAGLMVRLDADRWVTCGVALYDGRPAATATVTHGASDRSYTPLETMPEWFGLRLRRRGDALGIDFSVDGVFWTRHREAYLPAMLPVSVGPMAASPRGGGFTVVFRDLVVAPR